VPHADYITNRSAPQIRPQSLLQSDGKGQVHLKRQKDIEDLLITTIEKQFFAYAR